MPSYLTSEQETDGAIQPEFLGTGDSSYSMVMGTTSVGENAPESVFAVMVESVRRPYEMATSGTCSGSVGSCGLEPWCTQYIRNEG
ncbi:MAG: hypothetical protein IPK82_43515 [Polyangiaceae bacterium]|nr:hypothetical protein [Polyangiaceae bacterium]